MLQLLRVRRKLAVTGDDESLLKLWDLDRGECLQVCRGHTAGVHGVCVDWSSRRALSGSRDGTLMLWDLDCGACVQTMQDDGEWKLSVAMDWGAKRGLSGSRGGTLKLWDLDSAACLQTVRTGGGDVDCVAMHWSQRLALSSAHATFRLWDLDTGSSLKTFRGHERWISCLVVDWERQSALSGSGDGTLKFWHLDRADCQETYPCEEVVCCVTAHWPSHAVVGLESASLMLWDLVQRVCVAVLHGHSDRIHCVAMDWTTRLAVSGSRDGSVKIWNLESTSCRTLPHRSWCFCVALGS